jgi:TDP-4-amino-4,6-dideoxy-D-glucose deaminase
MDLFQCWKNFWDLILMKSERKTKVYGKSKHQITMGKSLEWLNLLPRKVKMRDFAMQIIEELFLRPYTPSQELCEKFQISKQDLREIYFLFRSSKEIKDLFEYSPYKYLTKILEHLSKDHERTLKIIDGKTPFPLVETMELFISDTCNARCKFCYRAGQNYEQKRTLRTQQYVTVINEFAELHGKNIDVSGGLEPLLSESIVDILKAGLNHNLKISLYTNGIALDNKAIVNYLLRIHRVRISFSAYDKKSYKEIMGVDKFDLVMSNLRALVEAKKRSRSDVKIGIGFVVFKDNYSHIPEIIKIAQKLGIDFLDLRSVEVTEMGDFDEEQRKSLGSFLSQLRREIMSGAYKPLTISIADTLNPVVNPESNHFKYVNKDFIQTLSYFRITITPHGCVYALNLIGQPSRGDSRYLLGQIGENDRLFDMLSNKKPIPFEQNLLLAHDISLLIALSKLKSDLEFGISVEENPFNWM